VAGYAGDDATTVKAPPEVLRKARDYCRQITDEAKHKIALIHDDDPDRKYKIYKAKLELVVAHRQALDATKGYSKARINERHKGRVKAAMFQAIKFWEGAGTNG
jgi:hypothetical protein